MCNFGAPGTNLPGDEISGNIIKHSKPGKKLLPQKENFSIIPCVEFNCSWYEFTWGENLQEFIYTGPLTNFTGIKRT